MNHASHSRAHIHSQHGGSNRDHSDRTKGLAAQGNKNVCAGRYCTDVSSPWPISSISSYPGPLAAYGHGVLLARCVLSISKAIMSSFIVSFCAAPCTLCYVNQPHSFLLMPCSEAKRTQQMDW